MHILQSLKSCYIIAVYISASSLLSPLVLYFIKKFVIKELDHKKIISSFYVTVLFTFLLSTFTAVNIRLYWLNVERNIRNVTNKSYHSPSIKFFDDKVRFYNFTDTNIKNLGSKVVICMYYTPEIEGYGALSEQINRAYAVKHGYDFFICKDKLSKRAPSWNKLKVIEGLLEKTFPDGNRRYDYVMWIDADAIYNLHHIKIEQLLDSPKDFLICNDYEEGINCGVFILKNTKWSREFIQLWWMAGKRNVYSHKFTWEQHVFHKLFLANAMNMNNKVEIRQKDCFNTDCIHYNPRSASWDKTYIVHLMGMDYKFRKSFFKKWLSEHPETK